MLRLAVPLIHLIISISNVFLLGWFANEVKVQSLAIGEVAYQTQWYNRDVRTQKLLINLIQQSQRGLTVSIGPFGPMTLETALNTMQASYSYIMLMRSFKK